jgi:hypothetical protein
MVLRLSTTYQTDLHPSTSNGPDQSSIYQTDLHPLTSNGPDPSTISPSSTHQTNLNLPLDIISSSLLDNLFEL